MDRRWIDEAILPRSFPNGGGQQNLGVHGDDIRANRFGRDERRAREFFVELLDDVLGDVSDRSADDRHQTREIDGRQSGLRGHVTGFLSDR
jgi:hypothetical protein